MIPRGTGEGGPRSGRWETEGTFQKARQGPDSGRSDEWGLQYAKELKDLGALKAERIVEIAEEVGKRLKQIDLKINQIRRFLDEARRIEAEVKRGNFPQDKVVLLRPKLAYAAGREKKVKDLMNVLDPALRSASSSEENFWKFLKLIEAIVAYHRFYGGTN